MFVFWFKYQWIFFSESNWQWVNIGSGNWLATKNIRSNGDHDLVVSLGSNELRFSQGPFWKFNNSYRQSFSPVILGHNLHIALKSGVLCQNQAPSAGTCNYIPQYLWDVIICPCSWYLLLAQHYWNIACSSTVCTGKSEGDIKITTCYIVASTYVEILFAKGLLILGFGIANNTL